MSRDITNDNDIFAYLHCGKCLEELPEGISPAEWSQTQAGWTPIGLQIWCNRHNCNVLHIDFEGQQHPANDTRSLTKEEMYEC